MAETGQFERLQPSLLDRLTDDAPGNSRETREDRVIDIRRLRDIVQRDLSWLLNTYNNDIIIDAERYPHAAKSVLKFGVEDITGDFSTGERAETLRRSIRDAIETFEPRIRPGSIEVELRAGDAARQTVVAFDIRADMWAEPIPLELYLRSEVDLTTGDIRVERTP
jgi:type VI secretion system protein ImpF